MTVQGQPQVPGGNQASGRAGPGPAERQGGLGGGAGCPHAAGGGLRGVSLWV